MIEVPLKAGVALGVFEVPLPWMQSTQDIQRLLMGGVNADGSLKAETILALLRFNGITARDVARNLGITSPQVREVVTRKRRTKYIQDYIATCIHMDADRVWGR